ncbi:hypothetical protein [Georgenia alba]|uniref:4,5-dihydroxyphthalate decarboxylase n=1 Tax=Georgenia alba TaxID=2233858 RepID=A0ABW2QBE6_9MICO
MSPRPVRIGTRHWDHVTPIALGDVISDVPLAHRRLETTPDLWTSTELDVAETSLSRYVRARAAGDTRVTALPVFVMRGFRHRCIVVREDAPFERPADLAGGRVGLTGWPDSGNVWTRALLLDAGLALTDVAWWVGRLAADHPNFDRLGGTTPGAHVRVLDPEDSLLGALGGGRLDAVMTPFMPPGFYSGSGLRTLHRDSRAAERAYFERHRFVPGIHLIAARTELLERSPALAQELLDVFERAKQTAVRRRVKLQDVLPWLNEEIAATVPVFGSDWMPYGWAADRAMVAEFQRQLLAQDLLEEPVAERDLFPWPVDPTVPSLQEQPL